MKKRKLLYVYMFWVVLICAVNKVHSKNGPIISKPYLRQNIVPLTSRKQVAPLTNGIYKDNVNSLTHDQPNLKKSRHTTLVVTREGDVFTMEKYRSLHRKTALRKVIPRISIGKDGIKYFSIALKDGLRNISLEEVTTANGVFQKSKSSPFDKSTESSASRERPIQKLSQRVKSALSKNFSPTEIKAKDRCVRQSNSKRENFIENSKMNDVNWENKLEKQQLFPFLNSFFNKIENIVQDPEFVRDRSSYFQKYSAIEKHNSPYHPENRASQIAKEKFKKNIIRMMVKLYGFNPFVGEGGEFCKGNKGGCKNVKKVELSRKDILLGPVEYFQNKMGSQEPDPEDDIYAIYWEGIGNDARDNKMVNYDRDDKMVNYDRDDKMVNYERDNKMVNYDRDDKMVNYDRDDKMVNYERDNKMVNYDRDDKMVNYDRDDKMVKYDHDGKMVNNDRDESETDEIYPDQSKASESNKFAKNDRENNERENYGRENNNRENDDEENDDRENYDRENVDVLKEMNEVENGASRGDESENDISNESYSVSDKTS